MIIAKLVGIAWMLSWFFIILAQLAKNFIKQPGNPFDLLLTLLFAWGLFGLLPVLIVKFGWDFIK